MLVIKILKIRKIKKQHKKTTMNLIKGGKIVLNQEYKSPILMVMERK